MAAPVTRLPSLGRTWPSTWPSLDSWPLPNLVLYHDKCPDGFGAAFSIWKSLGDRARYIGCKHGDEAFFDELEASVKGANVLVVDFAFSRPRSERFKAMAQSFLVLDHHASAHKELADVPYCYFDMKKSGARLAWEFMATHKPSIAASAHVEHVPPLIAYIEDRDLWNWKLEGSKEFNAAMDMVPFEFQAFDDLLEDIHVHRLIAEGRAILRFKDEQIKRLSDKAAERTWLNAEGPGKSVRALVVNSPIFQSEIGNLLSSTAASAPVPEAYPHDASFFSRVVAVIWNYDHESHSCNVSLRSHGDSAPDVSVLAKKYGGGGHPRASGLRWPHETIEGLFEELTL